MAKVLITDSKLTALANAIRTKNETSEALTLDEMKTAVDSIETGGGGGAYDITTTDNADGSQNILIVDASGGGGGAKEPYIEETYDEARQLIAVSLHGYTKIRNYIYDSQGALGSVELFEGLDEIGYNAFAHTGISGEFVIPSSVTTIHQGAVAYTSITTLTILGSPNIENGEMYGGAVFDWCQDLTSATIGAPGKPMNATKLPNSVFTNCNALSNITVYTEGGAALSTAPFGATNATVTYLPA